MNDDHPGAPRTDESRRCVLVAYATRHGSTQEVAETVAGELREAGLDADVQPIAADPVVAGYDAVVVGGPMIMGWHRDALRFVRRHRDALTAVPTALFITAASLTETGDTDVRGVPIAKDPWLVKEPRSREKLRYRERYARPGHYLDKVLDAVPGLAPVSVAFFAGSLDLTVMNIFEKLFVLLIIGASPGDGRHWEFVREWSRGVGPALSGPAR